MIAQSSLPECKKSPTKNERVKKIKEYYKVKSQLERKLIDTIQNKIFEIPALQKYVICYEIYTGPKTIGKIMRFSIVVPDEGFLF